MIPFPGIVSTNGNNIKHFDIFFLSSSPAHHHHQPNISEEGRVQDAGGTRKFHEGLLRHFLRRGISHCRGSHHQSFRRNRSWL
jgi:hypothetical protein